VFIIEGRLGGVVAALAVASLLVLCSEVMDARPSAERAVAIPESGRPSLALDQTSRPHPSIDDHRRPSEARPSRHSPRPRAG